MDMHKVLMLLLIDSTYSCATEKFENVIEKKKKRKYFVNFLSVKKKKHRKRKIMLEKMRHILNPKIVSCIFHVEQDSTQ